MEGREGGMSVMRRHPYLHTGQRRDDVATPRSGGVFLPAGDELSRSQTGLSSSLTLGGRRHVGEVPIRLVAGVLLSALVLLAVAFLVQSVRGDAIDETLVVAVAAIAFSTTALMLGPTGDQLTELNQTAREMCELLRDEQRIPASKQAPSARRAGARVLGILGLLLLGCAVVRHERSSRRR